MGENKNRSPTEIFEAFLMWHPSKSLVMFPEEGMGVHEVFRTPSSVSIDDQIRSQILRGLDSRQLSKSCFS